MRVDEGDCGVGEGTVIQGRRRTLKLREGRNGTA